MFFFEDAQTTDFTFRSEGELLRSGSGSVYSNIFRHSQKVFCGILAAGQRSNNPNPAVTYTSAGKLSRELITVYENTTAERFTQSASTDRSVLHFTLTVTVCANPERVIFNKSSSNIVRNEWDFGGEQPAYIRNNRKHLHIPTAVLVSFTATLTSFNETVVSAGQPDNQYKPAGINGTRTPESGCAPVNASLTPPGNYHQAVACKPVNWNFGGITVSNTRPKWATITLPGIYTFERPVQTLDGCTATYTFDSIRFGSPPRNHVAARKHWSSASEAREFVSHTGRCNGIRLGFR